MLRDCDGIIGSHVNKIEEQPVNPSLFKTFNILERCFHLTLRDQVKNKKHLCDIFLEPSLGAFDMYDSKQAEKIYVIGYEAALRYKNELSRIIQPEGQVKTKERALAFA